MNLGWTDGIHEPFQSGVLAVGHFISKGFFLSQHGIYATFILASLPLRIADGSYLRLDIIGTSRRDGKDGNRVAFSLLFLYCINRPYLTVTIYPFDSIVSLLLNTPNSLSSTFFSTVSPLVVSCIS